MSLVPDRRFDVPSSRPTSVVTHLWVAFGTGLLFALFMYVDRAPLPRSVGGGIVIGVAAFVLLRAMEVGRADWPPPSEGRIKAFERIQRWRLNGFDAAVDKVPGFSPHLRVRLGELATSILAGHDLRPGSPQAIAMLGRRTHELLYPPHHDPGQRRPDDPVDDELLVLMDRLIELSAEQHAFNRRGDT